MITRPALLAAAAVLLSYGPALAQSNSATECGTAGCIAPGQTHQSLGDGTNVGPGSVTGTGMGPQSDDANRLGGGNGSGSGGTNSSGATGSDSPGSGASGSSSGPSNPGPSGGGY